MAEEQQTDRFGARLLADTQRAAERLAPRLVGLFGGGQTVSRTEYLSALRTNWPDPTFRTDLLHRLGAEGFLRDAQAAWKEGP